MRDLSWMDQAVCAQVDPDLFHPKGKGAKYEHARRICQSCPVQPECGQHAQHLEGDANAAYRHGLWGAQVPAARAQGRAA